MFHEYSNTLYIRVLTFPSNDPQFHALEILLPLYPRFLHAFISCVFIFCAFHGFRCHPPFFFFFWNVVFRFYESTYVVLSSISRVLFIFVIFWLVYKKSIDIDKKKKKYRNFVRFNIKNYCFVPWIINFIMK